MKLIPENHHKRESSVSAARMPGGFVPPKTAIPKRINPADFAKLTNPFENFIALAVLALIVVLFIGYRLFWDESMYTPEEGVGYYMGMIGGIIMLVAYVYSVRKYIPGLKSVGGLRKWLRFHIFLGVFGPTLIMMHSTFHIGSLNGGMALIAMLLVVVSGVVGRYFYSKVHYGLYGRKAQLKEVQQILWLRESGIKSRLSMTSRMNKRLQDYEKSVIKPTASIRDAIKVVFTTWFKNRRLYRILNRDMVQFLRHTAKQQGIKPAVIEKRIRYARRMLWFYLHTIGKVVKFSAYERLLALWRMVHVPLLYLLMVSGVVHVIAVHMY